MHWFGQCLPTVIQVLSDILKEDRGNMHAEWASKVGINL